VKVTHLEANQTGCQVVAENQFQGNQKLQLKSQFVMNCSGPFSDQVRDQLKLEHALELTQGVHFITSHEKLKISTAFVMSDPKLHRILFAIPWNSTTYFGTTDTPIVDPTKPRATSEDLNYCLEILNGYFKTSLTRADVIQSWAAVRPLIKPKTSTSPSAISREHHIEEAPSRIFHILGGKLTSHRLMAKEALDRLSEYREVEPCTTHEQKLLNSTAHLKQSSLDRLEERIQYSIESEMALTPLDFMRRRSSLYYESPTQKTAAAIVEKFNAFISSPTGLAEIQASLQWDQAGY
jgi:glycerol-3-phosphate dehydrogenase